ncbi:MAG: hypothetical protein ABI833_18430 [Acidobacteriota bacterium]
MSILIGWPTELEVSSSRGHTVPEQEPAAKVQFVIVPLDAKKTTFVFAGSRPTAAWRIT